MKLETILDAMVATACGNMNWKQARRIRAKRQYRAFRTRILRMDTFKTEMIETLGATVQRQKTEIAGLHREIG